jgi:predicted DNA-binding transcriptional regulator AlpA
VPSNEYDRPSAVKPRITLVSPEVAREIWLGGISESTAHRLEQTDPSFPRRIEISPGRLAYAAEELDAYVAEKVAQRDAGHVPAAVLSGRRLGRSGTGGRPRKDPRQLSLPNE